MRYFINQIRASTLYFIAAAKWLKAASAAERGRWPLIARTCYMNAVRDLWCAFDCLSRGVGLGPLIPYK